MLFLSVVLAPHHPPGLRAWGAAAVAPARAPVLITEFYPCGMHDDEYFELTSTSSLPLDLVGWSVSDGEGELVFVAPFILAPGSSLVVSANSTSYISAFGVPPEIGLDAQDSSSRVSIKGTFRLGDSGDSLDLRSPDGRSVDFVVYGSCSEASGSWTGPPCPAFRKGEVAVRVQDPAGPQDTDTASDWMPFREYRYGYTEQWAPAAFSLPPGALTAFTSPDSSLAVVSEAISSAKRSLLLCGYELSSSAVAAALCSAAAEGVSVKVLVEGDPAGGMSDAQIDCLSWLAGHGVDVRVLAGSLGDRVVRHIGPLHAKYVVVDRERCIVLSMNFGESGLPRDTVVGNRGWGLAVRSVELARTLSELFEADSRLDREDVHAWTTDQRHRPGAVLPVCPEPIHRYANLAPYTARSEGTVRLFVSPDSSPACPFLAPLLERSQVSMIEQFQVDLRWSTRWGDAEILSPLVEALGRSIAAGGSVKMLLDSSWFNIERNSEVRAYVMSLPRAVGASECRLMDQRGPITVLHNKGLLLDGRVTVVSSNNWGYSSFARNREIALVVDSPEIASYFSRAFAYDWDPDTTPPVARCGESVVQVRLGELVRVDGSASEDDRAVVAWSWDLYGDGTLDGQEPVFEFVAARPGAYPLLLTVEDAWGNKCTDWVEVRLVSDAQTGGRWNAGLRLLLAGGLPFMCYAGAMLGLMLARRRAETTRKVNHPGND